MRFEIESLRRAQTFRIGRSAELPRIFCKQTAPAPARAVNKSMCKPITKPRVEDAIESAVRELPNNAAPSDVAKRVVSDLAIAPALKRIAW